MSLVEAIRIILEHVQNEVTDFHYGFCCGFLYALRECGDMTDEELSVLGKIVVIRREEWNEVDDNPE